MADGHEVVVTRGGAPAVRDRATGEVMHPVVGPRVEAAALYVEPSRLAERLAAPGDRPVVLLDVGLGAGGNAIAAWQASEARAGGRRLEIVSCDRTARALELALSHAADFGLEGAAGAAARAVLDRGTHETSRTSWRVLLGELPVALDAAPHADVVFWDPFSPRANPELWTVAAFAAARRVCRAGATLHTYSAATATRSALWLAGFAVGRGPAIGAKEETTQAALRAAELARPLDAAWLDRLARSSAPLPPDAPPDAALHMRDAMSRW
ncbi:MAG TPA: MnmC family methyltransferase [Kofleriaceae bacterium]|nr:MnmC family methyltransferase [Kofleriaceae bacterium]